MTAWKDRHFLNQQERIMAKNSGLTDAAKKLGAAGGKAGGPARAKVLTAGERKEIARKGGMAKQRKKK